MQALARYYDVVPNKSTAGRGAYRYLIVAACSSRMGVDPGVDVRKGGVHKQ